MWDKITFGSSVADETLNFGNKENNIYAYETKTFATIQRNEPLSIDEPPQIPQPISVCYQNTICIAIDNTLVLFDATSDEVSLKLNFDSRITSFTLCNNGVFLFVALSNLEIYCVHCTLSKYERISNIDVSFQSKHQSKCENKVVSICTNHDATKNLMSLFFVFSCGMIVRLSELDVQLLEESFNCDNSRESVDSIFKKTPHTYLSSIFTESENAIEAVCEFKRSLFISNGKGLLKLPLDEIPFNEENNTEIDIRRFSSECTLPSEMSLKKLECTQELLIGMTGDKKLIVICPFILLPLLYVPIDCTIKDYTIVGGETEETILLFTSDKLISLSKKDFSQIFDIKLPNKFLSVYGQNQDDPSFEGILFLELCDEDKVPSLRVKILEQTQPICRLEKLLRKGRFEEAKWFARYSSLDVQIVYQAEASRMFEALMPWSQSKTGSIDELINLLDSIEDVEFVAKCCINAITAEPKNTLNLLNYGIERVKKFSSTINGEHSEQSAIFSKLHYQLGCVVLRLNTYMIIYETSSVDQWIAFSKADLLEEIHYHLRKGELNAATIIWYRHWNQIHESFNYDEAIELLNDIPDTLSVNDLTDWLNEFVSTVVLSNPSALESIISWTIKKILSFELVDYDNWLEKGIRLAELVLNIIQKLEESCDVIGLETILIEKLNDFLKILHQISRLKSMYHINIKFDDFVQDNFNEVVFFLLTKSPVDSISPLINDLLSQILLEKKLDSDFVYSYCIERLVKQLPIKLLYPGAPWEVRAAKITHAIYDAQTRLECVLCLLKSAAVPWSKFIQEMVDEALTLNHPLTTAIHEQIALIPSKLILKRYGFTDIYTDEHMENIMKFIVYSDDENSLPDSLIIAKTINIEDDAYIEFIIKFIEQGDHKKVSELLNKMDPNMQSRIHERLNLMMNFRKEIDIKRLEPFLHNCASKDEGFIKSRLLESEIGIKSSVYEMSKKKKIEEYTDMACKVLVNECVRFNESASYLIHEANELSGIFEVPPNSILLKLVSFTQNNGSEDLAFGLLRNFVESAEENLDEKLCNELLNFLGSHMSNLAKNICNSNNPMEVSSLLRTLSNMCLKSSHPTRDILYAVEISKWVNIITGCVPQATLFSEDLHPPRLFHLLSDFVLTVLKEYISFAHTVSCNRIVEKIFESTIIPESDFTVEELPHFLMNVVNNLFKMEQSTVALQVVADLYSALSSVSMYLNEARFFESLSDSQKFTVSKWTNALKLEHWESSFKNCLSDILQKVVLKKAPNKNFDLALGLAMLNEYTEENAYFWLNTQLEVHSESIGRIKAVSILGALYWKMKDLQRSEGKDRQRIKDLHSYFMSFILKCQWGSKLAKLGLPYKEFNAMEKIEVIMRLIALPNVDLDILRDYCNDFQYDFNDCLIKYINQIILSWEPEMVVTVDTTGSHVLHVKNSTKDILTRMKSVSALIENHIEFVEHFTVILWKLVNCYYYELYFVLLDLFDHVSKQLSGSRYSFLSKDQYASMSQYRRILIFLINYRRISPPSVQEKEYFFRDFPSLHALPAISEFRLPFTYLVADKYNTIKQEISLTTYKLWFSVSPLFFLDKSMLCSLAINRMSSEKLTPATNKSKEEWCVHVCNGKLLDEIKECVSYISNDEVACACLFFVVNNLPPGADQVTAATMCYNHTAKWAASDSGMAVEKLEKVHKKLLRVSTTHILYKYNLARREYLDLVLNPSQLISALYHDPAILSRGDVKVVHCPDINQAVAEIGKVHNENTASVRLDLLKKWLMPDSILDDSITTDSSNIKSVAKLTDDDNLTRACYVLRYEEPKVACNYLVSIAFTKEMQSIEVKLRALQCLIKIVTPQHIYNATGKDLSSIRRYMKSLWFVYGLEQLGLNCNVNTFESRNKSDLVREILNQQAPTSPILAAHLCCAFSIKNPAYWNAILKLITESCMVDQLEELLLRLEVDWSILDKKILSSAWNCLILTPLSQVDELSEDKETQVKKILVWISKCPSPTLVKRKVIEAHLKRLNCESLSSLYERFL